MMRKQMGYQVVDTKLSDRVRQALATGALIVFSGIAGAQASPGSGALIFTPPGEKEHAVQIRDFERQAELAALEAKREEARAAIAEAVRRKRAAELPLVQAEAANSSEALEELKATVVTRENLVEALQQTGLLQRLQDAESRAAEALRLRRGVETEMGVRTPVSPPPMPLSAQVPGLVSISNDRATFRTNRGLEDAISGQQILDGKFIVDDIEFNRVLLEGRDGKRYVVNMSW